MVKITVPSANVKEIRKSGKTTFEFRKPLSKQEKKSVTEQIQNNFGKNVSVNFKNEYKDGKGYTLIIIKKQKETPREKPLAPIAVEKKQTVKEIIPPLKEQERRLQETLGPLERAVITEDPRAAQAYARMVVKDPRDPFTPDDVQALLDAGIIKDPLELKKNLGPKIILKFRQTDGRLVNVVRKRQNEQAQKYGTTGSPHLDRAITETFFIKNGNKEKIFGATVMDRINERIENMSIGEAKDRVQEILKLTRQIKLDEGMRLPSATEVENLKRELGLLKTKIYGAQEGNKAVKQAVKEYILKQKIVSPEGAARRAQRVPKQMEGVIVDVSEIRSKRAPPKIKRGKAETYLLPWTGTRVKVTPAQRYVVEQITTQPGLLKLSAVQVAKVLGVSQTILFDVLNMFKETGHPYGRSRLFTKSAGAPEILSSSRELIVHGKQLLGDKTRMDVLLGGFLGVKPADINIMVKRAQAEPQIKGVPVYVEEAARPKMTKAEVSRRAADARTAKAEAHKKAVKEYLDSIDPEILKTMGPKYIAEHFTGSKARNVFEGFVEADKNIIRNIQLEMGKREKGRAKIPLETVPEQVLKRTTPPRVPEKYAREEIKRQIIPEIPRKEFTDAQILEGIMKNPRLINAPKSLANVFSTTPERIDNILLANGLITDKNRKTFSSELVYKPELDQELAQKTLEKYGLTRAQLGPKPFGRLSISGKGNTRVVTGKENIEKNIHRGLRETGVNEKTRFNFKKPVPAGVIQSIGRFLTGLGAKRPERKLTRMRTRRKRNR